MPPRSVFRLLLFVLPPAACALTLQFLLDDADGWAMRGMVPSAAGMEWVVVRVLPGLVLAALAVFHLAVVLPAAWLAFAEGEGRLGARVAAATIVIGGAMLAVAWFVSVPGGPAWPTLLMAAVYGGLPASVLWVATSSLGRFALIR